MQNTKRKQISELEYSDHIFAGEGSVVIALDKDKTILAGDLEPLGYLDAYPDNSALKED